MEPGCGKSLLKDEVNKQSNDGNADEEVFAATTYYYVGSASGWHRHSL
jgi:hypothetical protein